MTVRHHAQRPLESPDDWPDEAMRRYWDCVDTEADGCWLWTGGVVRTKYSAYGRIIVAATPYFVHRVAFVLGGGQLDPALTVDHTCNNPLCVRWSHLQQVTGGENAALAHRRRPDRVRQQLRRADGKFCCHTP